MPFAAANATSSTRPEAAETPAEVLGRLPGPPAADRPGEQ